jgi:ribosomal protein S18 acetylase RimI-like enzyme
VNTNYHIFGYLCEDCENILELKFDRRFVEPKEFLQNDLSQGFKATPVDSNRKETIAWMFSLQTKVEDVGFWSYQPEEYRIWLASLDETFCGYVSLNSEDELNQIWVDEGYRRQNVATQLVEHICKKVLADQDHLAISQPTKKGRKFFQSIIKSGEIFGKKLR